MLLSRIGTGSQGGPLPDGVEFDGTNDYLNRTTALTGISDGKTFTISCVFYTVGEGTVFDIGAGRFRMYVGSNYISLDGYDASTSNKRFGTSWTGANTVFTHFHFLMSVDLSNPAKRFAFINDVDVTSNFSWGTYVDAAISFTGNVNTAVAATTSASQKYKGRLSHVYFDQTYRDLSIVSERRKFITADRKPVSKSALAALNPLVYLPMDDPATAHVNLGTGGNLTLNGTIARAGRGLNQYNAPTSDFSGSSQTLSKTFSINTTDFTLSFNFRHKTTASQSIVSFYLSSNNTINIYRGSSGADLVMLYYNGSVAWTRTLPGTSAVNRNYAITISNSASAFHVSVNGVVTTTAGIANAFAISGGTFKVCGDHNVATTGAYVSNVFFNTSYIDLSQASNRAKFVEGTGINAKPVDLGLNGEKPLGVSPLIYLPLFGNNAGKNHGTGGDFTVSNGPFTGARGPNEFWGNKADFDGSTGYLSKSGALTGAVSSKVFALSFNIILDTLPTTPPRYLLTIGNNKLLVWIRNTSGQAELVFTAQNAAGTQILQAIVAAGAIAIGGTTNHRVQISVDLSNASNRCVYVNNVVQSVAWNVYTDDFIPFGTANATIGSDGAYHHDGTLSEFYLSTELIDFKVESNRLKFHDTFGNPVDLGAQGKNPTGNQPLIYMRFDPSNQGLNSGSGGNFTKTGTINDGGQL